MYVDAEGVPTLPESGDIDAMTVQIENVYIYLLNNPNFRNTFFSNNNLFRFNMCFKINFIVSLSPGISGELFQLSINIDTIN